MLTAGCASIESPSESLRFPIGSVVVSEVPGIYERSTVVANTGTTRMNGLSVSATCVCVEPLATGRFDLAPGEKRRISFRVTESRVGTFEQALFVGEPFGERQATLPIHIVIRPPLSPSHASLVFERPITQAACEPRDIAFRTSDNLEITSVHSGLSYVQCRYRQLGSKLTITVKPTRDAPDGTLRVPVEITYRDRGSIGSYSQTLDLTVGSVVSVSPSPLWMGSVRRGSRKSKRLLLTASSWPAGLHIVPSAPILTVKSFKSQGRERQYDCALQAPNRAGYFYSELSVKAGSRPIARIPVGAIIEP